jgi:hypothetical protein
LGREAGRAAPAPGDSTGPCVFRSAVPSGS